MIDNVIYGRPVTAIDLVKASNKSGVRFEAILNLIKTGQIQGVLHDRKYYVSPMIPHLLKQQYKQEIIHEQGRVSTE